MTVGKLNASFDDTSEQEAFNTHEVQFLGLDTDTDFYLTGEDEKDRSIGFYFPDANIEKGTYPLAPDGDISAYYAVRGSLTWETLEGSLDITPDLTNETMRIEFKFSAKEGGSGTERIKIRGKGYFEGRMPWTLAAKKMLKGRRKT